MSYDDKPSMNPRTRRNLICVTVVFYAFIGACVYFGWYA